MHLPQTVNEARAHQITRQQHLTSAASLQSREPHSGAEGGGNAPISWMPTTVKQERRRRSSVTVE